tara:strand:+ start:30 stop:329 length:300 start_codon:yes stop_codon:yes gene_type:complete
MTSQQNFQETVNAPYLLYYVNAIIENEAIVKEQNEYIEKLKRKLDLMKKLKETNDVYDLLDTISSIEGIVDKNTSIIKSLENQIQELNIKIPMPTHNNN